MKKKLLKYAKAGVVSVVAAGSFVSQASADFTGPAVGTVMDMVPIEGWLVLATVAYAALFGIRKYIKTANRS